MSGIGADANIGGSRDNTGDSHGPIEVGRAGYCQSCIWSGCLDTNVGAVDDQYVAVDHQAILYYEVFICHGSLSPMVLIVIVLLFIGL